MNERDIFHAAIAFTDPVERMAYVAKVCAGDDSLKRHVEDMLLVYPELGAFLESPAVDWNGSARPPATAGRFQLGPELARGGMGIVYGAARRARSAGMSPSRSCTSVTGWTLW